MPTPIHHLHRASRLLALSLALGLLSFSATLAATAAGISPTTPAISIDRFPLNAGMSNPRDITVGPDGNLWFFEATSGGGSAIGRITPSGTLTDFAVPDTSYPAFMTAGPDGNIWYTRLQTSTLGLVTPSGVFTTIPLPAGNQPVGIVTGPDGNVWITERAGNQIKRIAPDGTITGEFPIPTANSQPGPIISGPDGKLWFLEYQKVANVTVSGIVTELSILLRSPDAVFMVIAKGPDGNIWVNEAETSYYLGYDYLDRIAPDGAVSKFPTDYFFHALASGSDGNLWATTGSCKGFCSSILRIYPVGIVTGGYDEWHVAEADIASGPDGRIWLAERGVVDVPDRISAFDPSSFPPAHFGFLPLISR